MIKSYNRNLKEISTELFFLLFWCKVQRIAFRNVKKKYYAVLEIINVEDDFQIYKLGCDYTLRLFIYQGLWEYFR